MSDEQHWHRHPAAIIAVLLIAIAILFALGSAVDRLIDTAPAIAEVPVPAMIDEPCASLARLFGPQSNLSELQKEEAWKDYSGRPFAWYFHVRDVRPEAIGSGFVVQAQCDKSPSLFFDVTLTYPAADRDYVLQLKKGSTHKLGGVMTRTSSLFGMSAIGVAPNPSE